MIFIGYVYKYIPATRVTFRGKCTREATFQVGLALHGDIQPIQLGPVLGLLDLLARLSLCTQDFSHLSFMVQLTSPLAW